jgi:hypothetical protein
MPRTTPSAKADTLTFRIEPARKTAFTRIAGDEHKPFRDLPLPRHSTQRLPAARISDQLVYPTAACPHRVGASAENPAIVSFFGANMGHGDCISVLTA